jgi:hypothetical protein
MELSGTWCLRRTSDAKLKRQQAECVVGVPTMVLSETSGAKARPYSFLGLSEGHRVAHETCSSLSRPRILTLEPERFSGMATAGFHPQWLHRFRAQAYHLLLLFVEALRGWP